MAEKTDGLGLNDRLDKKYGGGDGAFRKVVVQKFMTRPLCLDVTLSLCLQISCDN